MKNTYKVKKMTAIGVMSALVTILSFVQFPFPMAPYMKFDPNDIIVLICAICLGWKSTLAIITIRSTVRFLLTGGIFGEIAAFCSSIIFMSTYYFIRRLLNKRTQHKAVQYTISCIGSILVATASLMLLNYTFITPSNIFQKFTTGWELMELYHMSNKVYFSTFIVPVMAFNLIKWSAISVISSITQLKLPERYLNKKDVSIFNQSYDLNSEKSKQEFVKE